MRPALALAALLASSACAPAPAPVQMAATDASELLERFAAGAAPTDVCTPQGRALLRGAVRAYGAAMASGGVAWPAVPDMGDSGADQVRAMDINVLVAFAAGFVEASDFRGNARRMVSELALAQYPEISGMRDAARVACGEVAAMQQAAARFVLETERYREIAENMIGQRDAERLERQERRMARAEMQMHDLAAAVEARLNAS